MFMSFIYQYKLLIKINFLDKPRFYTHFLFLSCFFFYFFLNKVRIINFMKNKDENIQRIFPAWS